MNRVASRAWVLPLALALAFVALDSAARLRSIRLATEARFTPPITLERDSTSASGYLGNQHVVFAPLEGIDGNHWVMQTQSMLHDGPWRVRHSDYDGPPAGREVHWSSLLRWAAVGVAWVASVATGDSLAESVERVSPWVNILLYAVLLLILTPILARRFGALVGGVFVVACVTVYPMFQMFEVGIFDHHGLVAVCALFTSLFLVAGGAGWIRTDDTPPQKSRGSDSALFDWLPTHTQARPWFIASGIAGAAGLWISAATQIPVLIAIGVAAVIGCGFFARTHPHKSWQVAPELWRTWGIAGGASSLAFFALEYIPGHVTIHLEVNHPLHAVAWIAAGDGLFRLCRRFQSRGTSRDVAWLTLDAMCVAGIPVIMLAVPESFTLRPGSMLLRLHEQYIAEFQGLFAQIGSWSWAQINASIGVLPVLMLVPTIVLSASSKLQAPLRAFLLTTGIPALLFTLMALRHMRWLGIAVTLWIGALVVLFFVVMPGRAKWHWPTARRVLVGLAISSIGAIVPLLMFRNPSAGAGATGPVVVVSLGVALWASIQITTAATSQWTNARLMLAGVFLGFAMLPRPLSTLYTWATRGWNYRASANDVAQLVTRDVAHRLRARLGNERGTILGGPTTSTWMTYYGGMRSISTFYWENADGIALATDILGATASADGRMTATDSARKLIDANGITHIVLYSWDAMAVEYTRNKSADIFARQLLSGQLPSWLRPVPFEVPKLPYFTDPWLWIFEVAPGQTKEEALVRIGQYYLATNPTPEAVAPLNAALQSRPDFLPALIQLANVQFALPELGDFGATMKRIRNGMRDTMGLHFEDEVFLALAFDLDADSVQARRALTRGLTKGDERAVRRLAPDHATQLFVQLARRLGLDKDPRGMVAQAERLLPPHLLAKLGASAR